MTEQEAKLLLSVHRRFDSTPDDEAVAEALELVASNPHLSEWYEREQECIAALDAMFSEIAPPPDLQARILAECQPASSPKPRWFRRRAVLAAAAVLLLSLLGGALWLKRPYASGETTLAAYQKDMTTFLDRFFLLDYESEKIEDVTAWLARKRGVNTFVIPESLAAHPSLGCEVISWNDRFSYLICFDVDGELFHLFLLPGGGDLENPAGGSNRFAVDPKWAATSWTDGNDLYFCCTLDSAESFRRVLDRPVRMPQPGANSASPTTISTRPPETPLFRQPAPWL